MSEKNVEKRLSNFIEPLILAFSIKHDVKFIGFEDVSEDWFLEREYTFDDGLGGYTFKGLIDSLEKSYRLN